MVPPSNLKVRMSITYQGLVCPPASAQEIFEYIASEKFRNIDLLTEGFKNTFISATNFYTTDKCRLTWLIEEDKTLLTRTLDSQDLYDVRSQEWAALTSSKRYIVVDEDGGGDPGFEIECPAGSGVSSDDLYCGK